MALECRREGGTLARRAVVATTIQGTEPKQPADRIERQRALGTSDPHEAFGRGERVIVAVMRVPHRLIPAECKNKRAFAGSHHRHATCLMSCMSNTSTRNEGKGEEIGGKIKAGVGKLIGNEQMEAEGKAHELKGKAKQEAAKGAERTKGKVQEAVGATKNRVGAVLGNEEMEAEGRAKELEGEARQALNRK